MSAYTEGKQMTNTASRKLPQSSWLRDVTPSWNDPREDGPGRPARRKQRLVRTTTGRTVKA